MQKMMDCNIIEEIKGKTKQIARCICYILSHGGEGNWHLEKQTKFKFNNVFSANSKSRTLHRKSSYALFIKFGYVDGFTILEQIIIYSLRYV